MKTLTAEPKGKRLSSRVTETCRKMIDTLRRDNGISEAAVIEIAIRRLAESQYPLIQAPSPRPVLLTEERAEYRVGG